MTLPPKDGYDALGRLSSDTQLVDAQPFRTVQSSWSVDGAQRWQRQVTYPTGTVWLEKFDGDGRLVSKTGGLGNRTSTYEYVQPGAGHHFTRAEGDGVLEAALARLG